MGTLPECSASLRKVLILVAHSLLSIIGTPNPPLYASKPPASPCKLFLAVGVAVGFARERDWRGRPLGIAGRFVAGIVVRVGQTIAFCRLSRKGGRLTDDKRRSSVPPYFGYACFSAMRVANFATLTMTDRKSTRLN